jgi:hypothetical protein
LIYVKENWEFLTGLLIFWGFTIYMLIYSINLNQGNIVYTLDDAYIHMAIAKNFSQYGVWGITNDEFSSSSSSLLYTLLLSFIFLFGPNEIAPLVINLIFANLLIYITYYILKKNNLPSFAILLALILIIFFIPLLFLIFTGMEHTIQIFINVIFVYFASNILSDVNIHERKVFSTHSKLTLTEDKLFLLVASLVTMVRFEGMFLIIVVSVLFLFRKKIFYSLSILGLGFLPIIIFGLISLSYGWFFFPNPVILKGNALNLTDIESLMKIVNFNEIIQNPHILILLISAILIFSINFYVKREIWSLNSVMAFIFIVITCFHIFLIGATYENQNLSRYDGYLVALGLILLFISIKDYIPKGLSVDYIKIYISEFKENSYSNKIQILAIFLILFFFFYSFIPRSIYLIRRTPQASNNIYEQQYHMGLFLQKYYEGECVAVNDIGAINYLADIECLDLRGLGSKDIAKARLNDNLDEKVVYKAAKRRDCKIAIIYEDKDYGYDIPSQWTKVGEWKIKYNVVCGDDIVSFWATDPEEIDDLIDNLKDFSRYLPNTVTESGNYTK